MFKMRKYEQIIPNTLERTSSCDSTFSNNDIILPTAYTRSTSTTSSPFHQYEHHHEQSIVVRRGSTPAAVFHRINAALSTFLRSLLSVFIFPIIILPPFKWLNIPSQALSITPTLGRKVTGTLFGNRRGHVSFAIQENPKSTPLIIIELAVTTSTLVKEMACGLLRIALECKKAAPQPHRAAVRLSGEPVWTMYCNGRNCGYALSRACNASDWHVLSTVQSVSVGAGVIPVVDDGRKGGASEGALLYMRAKFERVVANRDSEAFYMMNPDGNGGPELGIFMLRI